VVVTTGLVATVVGLREALLGVGPYWIVNVYNKWLYLCALGREWVLGRHYASWTGRHGDATVITPMSLERRRVFIGLVSAAGIVAFLAQIGTGLGVASALLAVGVAGLLWTWPRTQTGETS